ncbi:HPP family protein [Acinetobacter calcoaceticus]|uniref:HPP family protein n=1 Tax=Acinetobacter calcoaceticus TaxID=471 RepID=A0A4V6NJF2_ACICA|nr:HPP family protein [Acinetobacter calcoaceticus]
MFSFFSGKESLMPQPSYADMLRGLVGGSLSILILLLLGKWSGHLFIMAPFGASCVLLYAAPYSPLAQPRNILFGHLLSASIGLVMLKLFGAELWSIALAVGIAIAMMQLLRCVHPPAGANPLVILLTAHSVEYGWSFLIFPVLTGAVALISIAWMVNNFRSRQKWPSYGLALWHSRRPKED